MKTIALLFVFLSFVAVSQQTLFPRKGVLWVEFEEDGHQWMGGANKSHATASDDPGFAQTNWGSGHCIKVDSGGHRFLFHNCCTTNIIVQTNFTGTIRIGSKTYRVTDLQ